nr:MAG: methionine--tRNA ligase [Bacteroidota bacterium]
MPRRFLVTAALPYANGPLHIGHLAGAYLPADMFVRYLRLQGEDVVFICGSDEHGVPITLRADREGVSPREIIDRYHGLIRDTFAAFGIAFDYYGRTSSERHHQTAQEFFLTLHRKGVLIQKTEAQLYDELKGMFLPDRYVVGTCPVCGFESAYGDQCERCGSALSPLELKNPRSMLSGSTPVLRQTTHWYLPLGRYQKALEEWIATKTHWKPNVLGQCRSWLEAGLADRAVTRDLSWGVPVPLPGHEGKVLYVWFEAPIGYISATQEWAERIGEPERWKQYWMDPETRIIHFIGKDNIVFHCIIFPAMLMAHEGYTLPDNVPANEFLNLEGQKISTSRNWAVWLHEYLEDFEPDLLRYVLAATMPETKDADFSWRDFQARVNGELADVLGNFIHRTMTFAWRYFGGRVPELRNPAPIDTAALMSLLSYPERIGSLYEDFRFREAVFETLNLARLGNKYFNDTTPWATRNTHPQACANTLYVSLQLCAALAVLLEPVLPFTAERLRRMLRLPEQALRWENASRPLLEPGHELGEPKVLFHKVGEEAIARQLARLHTMTEQAPMNTPSSTAGAVLPPLKTEQISYDEFARLDLRVGTVIEAERVAGTDRLMRLIVDLGLERRQVIAGIAEQYSPEQLLGRKVVVVANLAPRKLRGLESQGMILMAENPDGRLALLSTEAENGAVVR